MQSLFFPNNGHTFSTHGDTFAELIPELLHPVIPRRIFLKSPVETQTYVHLVLMKNKASGTGWLYFEEFY